MAVKFDDDSTATLQRIRSLCTAGLFRGVNYFNLTCFKKEIYTWTALQRCASQSVKNK